MSADEGVCYRICQVFFSAMGLLWALEKGYYAAHVLMCDAYVAAGVYWRISRPSAAE
jgi:hypothetical protein